MMLQRAGAAAANGRAPLPSAETPRKKGGPIPQAERVVGCLLHFSALNVGQPMAESALERKAAIARVVRTVTGPPLGCLPLLILRTARGACA